MKPIAPESTQPKAGDAYAEARERMMRRQLEARGIRDPEVLRAMGQVPRERFVPAFLRAEAYADRPLLIGYEQTISQPYIVAFMTEALNLKKGARVLEVGTGSGYQTAVLAELGADVYSIERIARLARRAARRLPLLGYHRVHLRVGDGSAGWKDAAPFDAILVTAGATRLPFAYRDQLREAGRLIIPIGTPGEQTLHRYTRHGERCKDEDLGRVAFVPLVAGTH